MSIIWIAFCRKEVQENMDYCLAVTVLNALRKNIDEDTELGLLILRALSFARLVDDCAESGFAIEFENAGDVEAMEFYYIASFIGEKYNGNLNNLKLINRENINHDTVYTFGESKSDKDLFQLSYDESEVRSFFKDIKVNSLESSVDYYGIVNKFKFQIV